MCLQTLSLIHVQAAERAAVPVLAGCGPKPGPRGARWLQNPAHRLLCIPARCGWTAVDRSGPLNGSCGSAQSLELSPPKNPLQWQSSRSTGHPPFHVRSNCPCRLASRQDDAHLHVCLQVL